MKAFVLIRLLLVVTATKVPSETDTLWKTFKTKFNKNYKTDEEVTRRAIWEQNMEFIALHNRKYDLGQQTYRLELNKYSDMNHEEFSQKMFGLKTERIKCNNSEYIFYPSSVKKLPDTVDWREKGFVTDVKDQGNCGSCWTFSATGSLEGQLKKKTGKLISLSEQNLLDCCLSLPFYEDACSVGGDLDLAFKCVKKMGGIDTEESYPYEEMGGTCRFQAKFVAAKCTGFIDIPTGNENALKHAVATIGPISVGIYASTNFVYYSEGILDDQLCNTDELNHGVLVIGYGTENGKDYWLIKNSYGSNWGDKGYIKMSRNKNNQCGIASLASYPLMG